MNIELMVKMCRTASRVSGEIRLPVKGLKGVKAQSNLVFVLEGISIQAWCKATGGSQDEI